MAGDYQHYLQQMLQKGFVRPESSKKHPTVWEYRLSESPRTPRRIAKLGAENHFYSPNSNGIFQSLDDKITTWEAHRQADVRRWRAYTHGQVVEASKAAEIIGLTALRTRSVRRVFTSLFEGFLGEFSHTFENPDVLFNHLSGQTGLLGRRMKDEMVAHLGGIPIDQESGTPMTREIEAIGRMMTYSVSEHFSIEVAKRFRESGNFFDDIFEDGPLNIQKTHNEVLENLLGDAPVRQDLTSLTWEVRLREEGPPWILPDCAVMSISKTGKVTPFLFGEKEARAAIVLPLSPRRVLIGLTNGTEDIVLSDLDMHAALCSTEFFVASERSNRLDDLSKMIGQGTQRELDEGLRTTMTTLNPFLTRPKDQITSYIPLKSCSVSGFGFQTTEDKFTPIAHAILDMAGTASRDMHLDQIQQIHVCSSVPHAIAHKLNVDVDELEIFGDESLFYQIPVENEKGLGFELFLNGWALGLIWHTVGEDHDYYTSLFFEALWQIHSRAILFEDANTFAETVEIYKSIDVSDQLSSLATDAALKYVAARHAAYTGDLTDQHREALRDQFEKNFKAWNSAELPLHGDQNERNLTCETLLLSTAALFRSATRYLGICQAQNIDAIQDIQVSEELFSLVEKHVLFDWLHRLDVDLLILFANFEKPFSREKVKALTDHIERLYWGQGAIVLREGNFSRILTFSDRDFSFTTLHEEIGKYASEFLPKDFDKVVKDSVANALSGTE